MKEILNKYIELGYSSRRIAKELKVSDSTIRYYLTKFNLKLKAQGFRKKKIKETGTKYCARCKHILNISEFYQKRNDKGISNYCKPCTKSQVIERQRAFKQLLVNYKGGKCVKCDYAKCIASLEFHHIEPAGKDFEVSSATSQKFTAKIKSEIDKCILLCSNCHKEEHYFK